MMSEKLTCSADFVPKIVITEPSPFPVANKGVVQNLVQKSNDVNTAAPAATTSASHKSAEFVVDSISDTTEDDTTVSASVSDMDSCTVSLEQTKESEPLSPLEEEEAEEATTEDGLDDDDEEEDQLRDVDVRMLDVCWRWLDGFSESKFMFPILLVLLVMPISAGFMGARYIDRCPLSSSAPLFLFMLGVLGTVVIACRSLVIARRVCGSTFAEPRFLTSAVVFGNLAILLLLITEMTSFLRISPSFEPGTANYCHRIFYTFTYWLNWTSLFVVVFMAVIHAPKFFRRDTSNPEAS